MQHAIQMAKRCKTSHKVINWPPCAAIQQVSVRLNNNFEYSQKFAGGASDSQIWITNYLVGAECDLMVPHGLFQEVITLETP